MSVFEIVAKIMDMMPHSRKKSAWHLAQRLGYFSIALGVLEIMAPRFICWFLGVRRGRRLVSFFGFREVATGVAILSTRNRAPFIWGRVAGDALDLAALMAALMTSRRKPLAGLALGSVAMITMIDLICAQTLSVDTMRKRGRIPDYSNRSGLPKGREQIRGVARDTGVTPVVSPTGVTLQ